MPVTGHTVGTAEKHVQVRLVLEIMKDDGAVSDSEADIVGLVSDLAVVLKENDDNSGSYVARVEADGPVLMTPFTAD